MKIHDEERDIYGAVYVQGRKYFLLEPKPQFTRDSWMMEGTRKWLVALDDLRSFRNSDIEVGQDGDWVFGYVASLIVIGSNALIDLIPVPVTKKVIRFYVTDDEEA
jgi:hypothetical protein